MIRCSRVSHLRIIFFSLSTFKVRPVGRYQILGGHALNGAQILGGHNHYFTTKCSKYWVGTCPCAPLVPTGLLLDISEDKKYQKIRNIFFQRNQMQRNTVCSKITSQKNLELKLKTFYKSGSNFIFDFFCCSFLLLSKKANVSKDH